jgi:pimeloyl-ACP methyl ester carboxylesterase
MIPSLRRSTPRHRHAEPPTETKLCCVQSLRLSDGRRLFVRRWRRNQHAGTVVVLHGMLDSSEGWEPLSTELTCGIIAFDLPGFGQSDTRPDNSIAGYADDVAEGLAMLGVERFTLVGHSLGGAVATALVERMPNKVAALILLAPVGFGRVHLAEACSLPVIRSLVQVALPWALRNRTAVTMAYLTMVTNGRLPEPALVDRITGNGRELVDGTSEAIRAIAAAGRHDRAFGSRRVRYQGPVVAVWGACDRLVAPSHRHAVLTALPQARVQVWPGMGHHPVRERFDELAELIADNAAQVRTRVALPAPSAAVVALPLAEAA